MVVFLYPINRHLLGVSFVISSRGLLDTAESAKSKNT
jgi:hypothetical protein